MIDQLLNLIKAEKKPYNLFIFIFILTSLAMLLSYFAFPKQSSVLLISFCIIPLMPILVKLIEVEEARFEHSKKWTKSKNYSILRIYALITAAFFISFFLWALVLPSTSTNVILEEQIHTLESRTNPAILHGTIDCNETLIPGKFNYTSCETIAEYYLLKNNNESLLFNPSTDEMTSVEEYNKRLHLYSNLRTAAVIFIASFIFGAGALFCLAWLASILAVFTAEIFHRIIDYLIFFTDITYWHEFAILTSLFSGLITLLGFFIVGLAGSLISTVIFKHDLKEKNNLINLAYAFGLLMLSFAVFYISYLI